MNLRQRFARFMVGRYGNDQFNQFLFGLTFFLIILSMFKVPYVYFIGFILLIYAYFRTFSRNIYQRQKENGLYLKYTYKIRVKINSFINECKQRKTHHIYRCPNCRQKIRVPRGRGKIEIRCQKCQTRFIKNS